MTAFSGLTLEQLEQEHQYCKGDDAILADMHRELLDRKQRREAGGQNREATSCKPEASHLPEVGQARQARE